MQTLYFDLRDTKGPQKGVEEKISAAAKILRDGGLLGIPTETVYGLAANGLDPAAVKRIFEAKGRPQDNPLILTIPGQRAGYRGHRRKAPARRRARRPADGDRLRPRRQRV